MSSLHDESVRGVNNPHYLLDLEFRNHKQCLTTIICYKRKKYRINKDKRYLTHSPTIKIVVLMILLYYCKKKNGFFYHLNFNECVDCTKASFFFIGNSLKAATIDYCDVLINVPNDDRNFIAAVYVCLVY